MIHRNDYNSFIISRMFGAFFGSVTTVLGPPILIDLFFLHQRGRAFTVFHACFNLGAVAGPTISAFISAKSSWTYTYWWTVGLVGVTLFSVVFFLHDTSWDREANAINKPLPNGFFANRFETFCIGTKVTRNMTCIQIVGFTR
jgi:MFS family permease